MKLDTLMWRAWFVIRRYRVATAILAVTVMLLFYSHYATSAGWSNQNQLAFERSHAALLSSTLEASWSSHSSLLRAARDQCELTPAIPLCGHPSISADPVEGGVHYVIPAVMPTCVHPFMIASLQQFAWPPPVRIHIISKDALSCSAFELMSPRVICYPEDSVVPGLSYSFVASQLTKQLGINGGGVHYGRRLAGWYLQQFLKLAGSDRIVPPSESRYVIWDADMVLVRPMNMFESDGRARLHAGGRYLKQYDGSYQKLFGRPIELAADGTSFVAHHMPVQREHLRAFMHVIDPEYPNEPVRWVERVIASINIADVNLGFSEYASYSSFLLQTRKESVSVVPGKAWVRAAPDASDSISSIQQCCPKSADYRREKDANPSVTYVGWEIGHFPECHYASHPRHYP